MIVVVDSSVLVAAFREQEQHSREAFRSKHLWSHGNGRGGCRNSASVQFALSNVRSGDGGYRIRERPGSGCKKGVSRYASYLLCLRIRRTHQRAGCDGGVRRRGRGERIQPVAGPMGVF